MLRGLKRLEYQLSLRTSSFQNFKICHYFMSYSIYHFIVGRRKLLSNLQYHCSWKKIVFFALRALLRFFCTFNLIKQSLLSKQAKRVVLPFQVSHCFAKVLNCPNTHSLMRWEKSKEQQLDNIQNSLKLHGCCKTNENQSNHSRQSQQTQLIQQINPNLQMHKLASSLGKTG